MVQIDDQQDEEVEVGVQEEGKCFFCRGDVLVV